MSAQRAKRPILRTRNVVAPSFNPYVRSTPVPAPRQSKRMASLDSLVSGYQIAMTDKYVLVTIAIVAFIILTHSVTAGKFTSGVIFDLLTKYPTNTLLLFIQTHYQRVFGFLILLPTAVAMRKSEQMSATLIALVIAIVLPPVPLIEYILIAILIGMFMFCQARDYTCKIIIIIAAILFYTLGWITLAEVPAPVLPGGGRLLRNTTTG
jgi:hypothetical protein